MRVSTMKVGLYKTNNSMIEQMIKKRSNKMNMLNLWVKYSKILIKSIHVTVINNSKVEDWRAGIKVSNWMEFHVIS